MFAQVFFKIWKKDNDLIFQNRRSLEIFPKCVIYKIIFKKLSLKAGGEVEEHFLNNMKQF